MKIKNSVILLFFIFITFQHETPCSESKNPRNSDEKRRSVSSSGNPRIDSKEFNSDDDSLSTPPNKHDGKKAAEVQDNESLAGRRTVSLTSTIIDERIAKKNCLCSWWCCRDEDSVDKNL